MNKIFKPLLTLALIACNFLQGEACFAQPKEITPKEIVSYDGHTDAVKCVAFSPDGKLIASGAADNLLRVWEPLTGKNVFVGVSHKAPIWGVAFSPDGKTITSKVNPTVIKDIAQKTNAYATISSSPVPDIRQLLTQINKI